MRNEPTTIILVHGFWSSAAHWSEVAIALRRRGVEHVKAIELPLLSLADDADRLRKMVDQSEGTVVLVGHSYGGMVITEAGSSPKVKSLVYIAAFAPDAGENAGELTLRHPPAAASSVETDCNGLLWLKADQFHQSFCQDLSPDQGWVMAVSQKPPMANAFSDRISVPAWRHKPSWYQLSIEDRMIHPQSQQEMAARLQPRRLLKLYASHASLISYPEEVTDLIIDAVQSDD